MAVRYLVGVALGFFAALVLFFIMQLLIANTQAKLEEDKGGRLIDFVMVEEDVDVEIKRRKPDPPPPPEEPPPDVPTPSFDNDAISTGVDIGAVDVDVDVNIQGGGGFTSDGEYLPIVKVAPVYPRRALSRGIEGYVIVEFTVTRLGTVKYPVVAEAKPPGIFDRAAVNAALKFKYKPKVVDGEPIEVPGVRNRITFELADS